MCALLVHDAAFQRYLFGHLPKAVPSNDEKSAYRCHPDRPIVEEDFMNKILNNSRLFFHGALLSYIALFHWLRPMTYLAPKVVSPLFQILFFTLLGMYA